MTAEEMRKHNLEVLRKQGLTPGPTTQQGVPGAVTQGAAGPTTQQTPYQQALAAYQPQRYTFWNGGRVNDGFKIDNSNAGTWNQIQQLYNAGDRAGATALVNELSGKGLFSGYYDDNGNYNGFVQGYTGSANASYQPVVGGRLISSGDTDTGIWLTPDGKALKGTTGGMLTDNGDTWSRFQPNQGSNWTWKDVREQNGLDWGDTYAIRAAHGDFTNPALNTPEGNARKLDTLYEKPGGFTDEEWAKHTSTYDPTYIAEIAAAAGGNGQYPSGGTPAGQTPYQQALDAYQPMSYEEWRAQNGGGSTPSAQPMTAPEAYDPNSDPLYQDYLRNWHNAKAPEWNETFNHADNPIYKDFLERWQNAQAPEYAGDPYQAQRDAALAAYGEKWQGSEYQPLRDEALQRAASMEWNYDPNTDPVWQALQKQYRREGQRATEDTLGRYAAMTGGMPSTAAVRAAQQAGNYYAAQLSDRLPQVYQDAYNRYLQEYQRQLGISDAYAGFDDREYARWRDQQGQNLDLADRYNQYGQQNYSQYLNTLDQWNRDRNFAYGSAQDSIANDRADYGTRYSQFQDALDQWNRDRSFAYNAARDNQQLGRQQAEDQYGRVRDAISDARYEDETAYERYRDQVLDERYEREYLDSLSRDERDFLYKQLMNEQDRDFRERQFAYGVDQDAYSNQLKEAQLRASMGDYSGLESMGFDTSSMRNPSYAYASDGSTYDFSTQKAQAFVTDAPNGSTMRGGDGSIWRKDEYGGVTIEKNGKIYTFSAGKVPAQTSTGSRSGGGSGSGSGSSGSGSGDLYVDELIAAGITDPDMAIQWLDRKYPKMTVQTKNAVVNSLTKALGGNEGPSSEDKIWARGIMEGVAKGQYKEDSWVAQRAKEILGIEGQTGTGSSANVEDQSAGYRNMDETLGRMVSRGASRDEIFTEIDAEVKDGRITKEQGAALKEKYYGQADNIENSGQYHSDGRPKSSFYTQAYQGADDLFQRNTPTKIDENGKKVIDVSVAAPLIAGWLLDAYDTGKIHKYEITMILDELERRYGVKLGQTEG